MNKEGFSELPKKEKDYITETHKFSRQSYDEAVQNGQLYEWFEEMLIMGRVKAESKIDDLGNMGIHLKALEPQSKKEVEYYTTDPEEISRLHAVLNKIPIVLHLKEVDDSAEDDPDDMDK